MYQCKPVLVYIARICAAAGLALCVWSARRGNAAESLSRGLRRLGAAVVESDSLEAIVITEKKSQLSTLLEAQKAFVPIAEDLDALERNVSSLSYELGPDKQRVADIAFALEALNASMNTAGNIEFLTDVSLLESIVDLPPALAKHLRSTRPKAMPKNLEALTTEIDAMASELKVLEQAIAIVPTEVPTPAPTENPLPTPAPTQATKDGFHQDCWDGCQDDGAAVCEPCGKHGGRSMYCCNKEWKYDAAHNCYGANFSSGRGHRCVTQAEVPTPAPTPATTPDYGGSCAHGELIQKSERRQQDHCGSCISGYILRERRCEGLVDDVEALAAQARGIEKAAGKLESVKGLLSGKRDAVEALTGGGSAEEDIQRVVDDVQRDIGVLVAQIEVQRRRLQEDKTTLQQRCQAQFDNFTHDLEYLAGFVDHDEQLLRAMWERVVARKQSLKDREVAVQSQVLRLEKELGAVGATLSTTSTSTASSLPAAAAPAAATGAQNSGIFVVVTVCILGGAVVGILFLTRDRWAGLWPSRWRESSFTMGARQVSPGVGHNVHTMDFPDRVGTLVKDERGKVQEIQFKDGSRVWRKKEHVVPALQFDKLRNPAE